MKWSYLIVGYLGLFVMGMLDNLRAPFYPNIIESLGISYTQASFFYSLASLAGFLGSLLSVRLIHKIGILNVFRLSFCCTIIFCFGLWKTDSFTTLLLSGIFYGFGAGLCSVVQNIIVVEGSTVHHHRRALNGLHSMYALASLLAPLICAHFFSLNVTWQKSFFFMSMIPILGLAFLVKISIPSLKSKSLESFHPKPTTSSGYRILLSLCILLPTLAEITISTRLPLYMKNIHGMTSQVSAYYLSGFFFCLLLGRLVPTFFHFPFIIISVFQLSCIEALILYILGLKVHPVFLSFTGISIGPIFPTGVAWIRNILHQDHYAGLATLAAVTCGGILLLHNFLGVISDAYGVKVAFYVGPICLVLGLILIGLVGKMKPKN